MSSAPGAHREARSRSPGPGHADLAGMQKYGFTDARDVLERASARGRPRRGSRPARWPRSLLSHLGIAVLSHVVAARRRPRVAAARRPAPGDLELDRRVGGPLLRPRRRGAR